MKTILLFAGFTIAFLVGAETARAQTCGPGGCMGHIDTSGMGKAPSNGGNHSDRSSTGDAGINNDSTNTPHYNSETGQLNSQGNEWLRKGNYLKAWEAYDAAARKNPYNNMIIGNFLVARALDDYQAGAFHFAIMYMKAAMQPPYNRREQIVRELTVEQWYTKIMNQDACERDKTCTRTKGGDYDCDVCWNYRLGGRGYVVSDPPVDEWLAKLRQPQRR